MNIMEIQNVQYAYDGKKNVLKGILPGNGKLEAGQRETESQMIEKAEK